MGARIDHYGEDFIEQFLDEYGFYLFEANNEHLDEFIFSSCRADEIMENMHEAFPNLPHDYVVMLYLGFAVANGDIDDILEEYRQADGSYDRSTIVEDFGSY